jgi:hypothetical protein
MNYPAAALVACMIVVAAPQAADARRNCDPMAIQACKDDAARLCRDLPRSEVAKCLDDLTEDCTPPSVLCEPQKFGFDRGPRPRPRIRPDPMDVPPALGAR